MKLITSWLSKYGIVFLRLDYLSIFWGIWCLSLVSLVVMFAIKKWKRPARARDSRFRLIGRDASWLAVAVLTGLMILALADPYTQNTKTIQVSSNVDIIVAFDISGSMAAKDVAPSRHEVAIKLLHDFVSGRYLQPGDRLTLFTFASQSNWRMPLSDDWNEFQERLSEIEHPKDRIYHDDSQRYTDMVTVLNHIPRSLDRLNIFYKNLSASISYDWMSYPRMVILVSDGDDGFGRPMTSALEEFKKRKIPIYVVGIGTKTGASITIRQSYKEDGKDIKEDKVVTRLEPQTLKYIADQTDGDMYVIDSPSHRGLGFLSGAVSSSRKNIPRIMATQGRNNLWWTILAIPSILLLLFMVKVL